MVGSMTAEDENRYRPSAKLTADDVRRMRREYKEGNESQRQIAERYGLYKGTVQRILNHETWKDV